MKIYNTQNLALDKLKILVYAESGAGKTTLASTIKERVLVISAESGLLCLAAHSIDVIDITADDNGNMIPEEKRMIRLGDAYKYLLTDECKKKYDWIFIDSLTELSQNLIKSLQVEYPDRKDSLVMYGENSKKIRSLIKSFRDLPFYNVVFTALSSIEKDENNQRYIGVDMVGKIATTVPALFDICLYLAKTEEGRFLVTGGTEKLVAKDRSGKLSKQEPANLQVIIDKIRGV